MGSRKKLDELVLDYLADDIADEDFSELESRLRSEPLARRRFAQLSEEEVALWQLSSALEEQKEVEQPAPAAPAVSVPVRRAWRARLLWAAGAAAAAAAILLSVWVMRPDAPPDGDVVPPPAQVISIAAVEGDAQLVADSGAKPLTAGEELKPGSTLRTADGGTLKLTLPGGTEVEMGVGTELTVEGAGRLALARGEIRADVAARREGDPLTITTPDAEVSVPGTVFHLGAWPQGSCLRVLSGRVRLKRLADGQSVDVAGGQHAVLRVGTPLAARKSAIAFDERRVFGNGTWKVLKTAGGPLVRQENASPGRTGILFGDCFLRRGLVSGQFRVLAAADPDKATVGYVLHYPTVDQEPGRKPAEVNDGLVHTSRKLLEDGFWWNFNTRFELRSDNSLVIEELFWREGAPVPLRRSRSVYSEPAFAARTLGGFGLNCWDASVEYRNLRFTGEPTEEEVNLENKLLARIAAVPAFTGMDLVDARYTGGGDWIIEGQGPDTVIKQLDAESPASIVLFGRPKYVRGTYCGQFKMLHGAETESTAGKGLPGRRMPRFRTKIDFNSWGRYGINRIWAGPFLQYPGDGKWPVKFEIMPMHIPGDKADFGDWVNFMLFFEFGEEKRSIIYGAKWSEREPLPTNWVRSVNVPRPTQWIKSRGSCNVGLGARGGRVIWRNLKLLDTVPADLPPDSEPPEDEKF